MLRIRNLHAGIEEKKILNGINLDIKAGEVHAIMGPNGSGKSTLASVLAGRENYEVTEGSVDFSGKDLLELAPEERAGEGLFLAFQYPVEIPGLTTTNFIKTAVNEIRKYRRQDSLDAVAFLKLMTRSSSWRGAVHHGGLVLHGAQAIDQALFERHGVDVGRDVDVGWGARGRLAEQRGANGIGAAQLHVNVQLLPLQQLGPHE